MLWYYLSDADEQIPVEEEEFLQLIGQGVVRGDTQVWREDMADWYEAQAVLPDWFAPPETLAPAPEPPAPAQPVPPPAPVRSRPRLIVGAEADSRTSGDLLTRKPIATSTGHIAPVGAAAAPVPSPVPGVGAVPEGEVQLVRQFAAPLVQAQGWMKLSGVLLIILGIPYIVFFGLGALFIWMGVLLFQAAGKAEQAALLGHKFLFLEAQRKLKTYFTAIGIASLVSIIAMILSFVLWGAAIAAMLPSAMRGLDQEGKKREADAAETSGTAPGEKEEEDADEENSEEEEPEELPTPAEPPEPDPFG